MSQSKSSRQPKRQRKIPKKLTENAMPQGGKDVSNCKFAVSST